jgi:hypothetical protein
MAIPVLLRGSECWNMNKYQIHTMEMVAICFLRAVAGYSPIKRKKFTNICYYKNKGLSNKTAGTCGNGGRSVNMKNPFEILVQSSNHKRDPGRSQKIRKDQFLISSKYFIALMYT